MEHELRQCKECGKLFAAVREDQYKCGTCHQEDYDHAVTVDEAVEKHGCETIDAIVALTGLAEEEVLAIVRESSALRQAVRTNRRCERCQRQGAQPDSPFCIECRIELNEAFGKASEELKRRVAAMPRSPKAFETNGGRMHTFRSLDEKRRLTGSSRIDPTPRGKY